MKLNKKTMSREKAKTYTTNGLIIMMNCDKLDDIILFKPITFVATITGCKTKER